MLDLNQYETTLDPERTTHLGIWRDELDDLTREFFDWNVPGLPVHVVEAMRAGVRHDLEGMNLENVADLLEPGYLPLETGIAPCANGEGSVAIWSSWPGTTRRQTDWRWS